MEHQFVVADGLSDEALYGLISAATVQIAQHGQTIARLEQIRDMAKLKLLAKAIAEAERE